MVIDSIAETLANELPGRFTKSGRTLWDGAVPICLESVIEVDCFGIKLLSETDIGCIWKMDGLTWQESIFNAAVHWIITNKTSLPPKDEECKDG